jgi:putative Ca2+/H+ antiporter (TMEM165/GDT1 family)
MNITEIFHAILQQTHAAWNCAATVGGWFSAELLCSMTVNVTILAAVLFGAVWLVMPQRAKERSGSTRNGTGRS